MAKALKTVALVAGVAALAVVTGGAAAGFGLALSTTVAGISAGTLIAISTAASLGSALLTKGPDVPASQTERLRATIDPRAFRKTVFGQTAMPVDVRYEEWSGAEQEYCDWIVAHASHAIDGVEEIWFNTEMAWSQTTGVTAKFRGYFWLMHLALEGGPDTAITFGAGKWNGSARLTGCAWARWRFKVTGNGKKAESPFSGGPPSRVTVIGRGAKLYDPRRDSSVPGGSGPMRADDQSTWRYTTDDGVTIGENLPLQILYRVIGWRIRNPASGVMKLAVGSGLPARRLSLPSFQVAANLADELVNRSAGGQEPRYHGAGVVSEGDDPKRVLDVMCTACCGAFSDAGGKLSLVIRYNDLALAAMDDGLNDDDVIGSFTWDPDPSAAETPNVVRGQYVDPTPGSLYQLVDYPEVRLPSIDGQDRIFPLDLGVVESPSHAQRVGKQVLQRKQYLREFTAPFDIRAWRWPVGAVVPFTFAALSFNRKLFRVAGQEIGQGGACVMTLREESQAIYAWDRDDAASVQAAEAIVYDARNNPLVRAIAEAGTTAEWNGVTGPGKPDDNATNGADPDSPFGPDGTVGGALIRIGEFDRQIAAANARQDVLETETIPAINEAVAAAGERIDDARADMDSEVGRLDQRINEAVAEGGYDDTAVKASIREIERAYVAADKSLADRQLVTEAQMRGEQGSNLLSRISASETALTDGRFATTQRANEIVASVGAATGRIGAVETAITDGRFAASSTVATLRAEYDGTAATVTQQAGAIVNLNGRTAAYVRFVAMAGDNRAVLTLSADANGGAGVDLGGDLRVTGNAVIDGTLTARAIDASSFSREGEISWSGMETPQRGQIIRIPVSLTLPPVLPKGRFQFDVQVGLTTNQDQEVYDGQVSGQPVYRRYMPTGGLAIFCVDNQGNRYNAYNPGGSNIAKVRATTEFTPVFYIEISRGAQYTGLLEPGDSVYYRNYDADYSLYSVRINVTWLAI